MTAMAELSGIRVLTFDLYGTLVDMQGGLTEAISPFLQKRGFTGTPGAIVTRWRRTHFQDSMIDTLLQKGHTPFREVSRRALAYTLLRAGIPFTQDELRELVARIERLRPYRNVVEALATLKQKYALVILSNGDPDMLEKAAPFLSINFDRVISAAQAGAFKPHPAVYRAAVELLQVEPTVILHVASHPFDLIGAKAFGLRTAYVNRLGRPFGETPYIPDLEVHDFHELTARLV